jgi:predicted small metal-binding protein
VSEVIGMEALKTFKCDPSCGFVVRSHDEKELIDIAKSHAKKMHKMGMSDDEIRKMLTQY